MELVPVEVSLPAGVRVLFTSRNGGVSDPPFHSLNLSVNVGDDTGAVHENRMRLAAALPSEPMWLRQAHSNRVLLADDVKRNVDVADASFTSAAGVVCAVQTADCLPVLLFHEDGRTVGAAHAGWRGLAAGVLENAVEAMRAVNASPLFACVGPAISAAHYVVGADVVQALGGDADGDDEANAAAGFARHPLEEGKWLADLPAIAARRLHAAGVARVETVEICTFARRELLFSARRDAGRTGRQVAAVFFSG